LGLQVNPQTDLLIFIRVDKHQVEYGDVYAGID
jgi:hypothetical protein